MIKLDIKKGLVNNRESTKMEFKKSFNLNTIGYIRTIASFANNTGGSIVFGVTNSPRKPIGLGKKILDFDNYDTKELSTNLQNILSSGVEFELYTITQKVKGRDHSFGVLEIKESSIKPVICKRNDSANNLREGAVYFRYSGKSEEIKAQDLIHLIQTEKDKERDLWVKNIQRMAKIGINKVGVFDYDGELFAGDKKVIIDKDTVQKIKFIKDGHFVEKEGTPALVLKGEIKNIESLEVLTQNIDPNVTHPYEGISSVIRQFDQTEFYITLKNKSYNIKYILQLVNKKDNIENNPDLFWKNTKGNVKKYSEKYIEFCRDVLNSQEKLNSYF